MQARLESIDETHVLVEPVDDLGPDEARLYDDSAEETPQRTSYGLTLLVALNTTGKHIYEGTVGRAEVARRRRKNKAARKARRHNR